MFLARHAEGLVPVRRFIASYIEHPAGIEHDLIVIFKGFTDRQALADARGLFASLPHLSIEVSDEGLDIDAYLAAGRFLGHKYLCFVNTFTYVCAPNWLRHLHSAIRRPGVGVAGAMGSYESLYDSLKMIYKVVWLLNRVSMDERKRIERYYDAVLDDHRQLWAPKAGPFSLRGLASHARAIAWRIASSRIYNDTFRSDIPLDAQFDEKWQRVTRKDGALRDYDSFPRFPNPHIRTNGFIVDRTRLLECAIAPQGSKIRACHFESGHDGLSRRWRSAGLMPVVVDREGVTYLDDKWPESRTFRSFNQQGLMLRDNRCLQYEQASVAAQLTFQRMTWGDASTALPADYPDLGLRFSYHSDLARGAAA